jgi:hypothetical protein
MQRYYVGCPTCGRRLRLMGQSLETFGDPPGPTERCYRCPNCSAEWIHDCERNMLGSGGPLISFIVGWRVIRFDSLLFLPTVPRINRERWVL